MGLYSIVRSARWFVTNYPADKYARLLERSEHWSREQMEDYRNNKLRKLIAHCYENVPYYRNVMEERQMRPEEIRCAEDLEKLPVLTKDIVRNHTNQLLAKNVSDMTTTWTKTGGTTGEPMRICKNRECAAWSSMCIERGLGWGGKTIDEPMIRLFGGALGIDKTSVASRDRRQSSAVTCLFPLLNFGPTMHFPISIKSVALNVAL